MSLLRDQKSQERMVAMNTTHGLSKNPAYSNWKEMKKRCFNPANKRYKDYAERGISVHADFVNNFPAWLQEIGPKPDGKGWSVGRKDNNGWYTYGNIEWQRSEVQARNHSRQRNNSSGITGVKIRTRAIAGGLYTSVITVWSRLDGTRGTKDFSADKYGIQEAVEFATAFRNDRIAELNAAGASYAPTHGDDK